MKQIPSIPLNQDYYSTNGGEDQITPKIEVNPGLALITQNYELDKYGSYRLIDGYEAFDGRPKPSEASYWILDFDAGSAEISVEDIVLGDTSGSYGEVLVISLTSGSWVGGDAAGQLVLFNVNNGLYENNEVLSVSGSPKAIAEGVAVKRGAADNTDDSIWLLAAIEATRADIESVPGIGDVLGVWAFDGVTYAFRNDLSGTMAKMYASSSSGWTEVDLGTNLNFDTGSAAFVEGEIITQGGVTAIARRVYKTGGAYVDTDATGYFTISDLAGGNFSAGAITGNIAGVANATGVQTSNYLLPNGRYEFMNKNFGGHVKTQRMYGVDGVNKGWEWDGTYFVFIATGMLIDAPIHLAERSLHLFYSFLGGSLQFSAPGTPYIWSVVVGAGEIGMGHEITGFITTPDTLVVIARNSVRVLYGKDASTFDLRSFADDDGGVEWTIQEIGPGVFLGDQGLTDILTTQKYGDFLTKTLSEKVDKWLKPLIPNAKVSIRSKTKNQYRLIFDDKQAMTMTLDGNKVIGITRQRYDVQPVCTSAS